MRSSRRVVVIGGGAAGALSALHLARHESEPVEVAVVEPRPAVGRGVAYSTDQPSHLLNVRADYLSALPDVPGHFTAWAAAKADGRVGTAGSAFLPRMCFGEYLESTLGAVDHVRDLVCDLVPEHGGVRVQLAGGSSRMADQVILALGSPPGSWPAGLAPVAEDRRMVGDPWAPGALDGPALNELDPARPVVLLGSGLTAVDVAISLRARGHRHLIATSRHGLLPRAHGQQPLTLPAQCPPAATTARELLVWARRASGRIGAWEPVVDALRPDVNDLWAALAPGEQRRLLRHLHRRWEVLRHRMAPEVAATIGSMRERDELTVVTGGVRAARPVAGGVDVVLADREVRAAAVVNCTGPSADIRRSGTPLVRRLLASGIVRPGPLALGLDTDPHGCVPGTGAALWVVGPLRRGGLWETTAIPEIRAQAALLPQLLATTHQPVEV